MTNRETAIRNARALAQQIFAEEHLSGNQAYYVERDGGVTRDEYVGNFYERQSVYFGETGHAERVLDTGLGSADWNGSPFDFAVMEPIAETNDLPKGEHFGDAITDCAQDLTGGQIEVVTRHGTLYWDCGAWCRQTDQVINWRELDIENPSDRIVDAIEALEQGYFDDERQPASA